MQTSSPNKLCTATLFSRERRRQRMLQFLEAFDRRSWRCAPETSLVLPWSKPELRDTALAPNESED